MLEYAISGGMKGANDEITKQKTNSSDGHEISRHVDGSGGVFEDMLEERETQEVKELRDAYYRILNEADKYDVTLYNVDDESQPMYAIAKKVSSTYFDRNINVYNPNGYAIRVIQDNKFLAKHNNFDPDNFNATSIYDFETTISIEREFIPKFYIEKFANKVVVLRHNDDEKFDLHLYTTQYASQFGKLDAILISELVKLKENKNYNSDLKELSKVSFVTDKAYGSDDRCVFEYDNLKYRGIDTYDGNFVLIYECRAVRDGVPIGDKYVTNELTEKYNKTAPKKDAVNIFAIERKIDKENNEISLSDFEKTTIKIKK